MKNEPKLILFNCCRCFNSICVAALYLVTKIIDWEEVKHNWRNMDDVIKTKYFVYKYQVFEDKV